MEFDAAAAPGQMKPGDDADGLAGLGLVLDLDLERAVGATERGSGLAELVVPAPGSGLDRFGSVDELDVIGEQLRRDRLEPPPVIQDPLHDFDVRGDIEVSELS